MFPSLRCVLLPLLGIKPPQQNLFIVVDSIDEGCNYAEGEQRPTGLTRTIAELLASHHDFFPPWLMLVCSSRRQSKMVTKMFTGELVFLTLSVHNMNPNCVVLFSRHLQNSLFYVLRM